MNGMMWVRIVLGALWINGGLEKLLNPDFPELFGAVIRTGAFVSEAPAWFQGLMQTFVVPHAELVALSAGLGELALGVSLVLGFLTNLGAGGSIALSLSLVLCAGGLGIGTGMGAPGFLPFQMVIALSALAVALSPGSKAFSVDAAIARARPRLYGPLIDPLPARGAAGKPQSAGSGKSGKLRRELEKVS